MGLDAYETDLCACGNPRSLAWHTHYDGFWHVDEFQCFACTARAPLTKDEYGNERRHPVIYRVASLEAGADVAGAPPFVLGRTTTGS